jgi:beta-lactamase regulating signal transducer with metallopeptidase domain
MNALTDWLIATANQSAEALLVWSWQALVLLVCAWLALKICRVKSPALRHRVWLIALITVALLPLLAAAARRLPLAQSNNRALSYVAAIPRAVIAASPAAMPAPVSQPRIATNIPAPKKPFFARASVQALVWATIFLVWGVGVGVALIRLWRQLAGLRRLRANAQPVSAANLNCADCQPELLTAKIGFGLSAEINSPVLIGARHPMILLPADIAGWTTAGERCAMLRHELAHVERREVCLSPTEPRNGDGLR